LTIEARQGLAGSKPLLSGKLTLRNADAVCPYPSGGLGCLPSQLVHLLALLFPQVPQHISGIGVQELLGLGTSRRLLKELLSLIVIGLVDILGLAVLLEGLLLLRTKTSNRLSGQVERCRRCLLRLPKCLTASSSNLRVWYILGSLCGLLGGRAFAADGRLLWLGTLYKIRPLVSIFVDLLDCS